MLECVSSVLHVISPLVTNIIASATEHGQCLLGVVYEASLMQCLCLLCDMLLSSLLSYYTRKLKPLNKQVYFSPHSLYKVPDNTSVCSVRWYGTRTFHSTLPILDSQQGGTAAQLQGEWSL